MATSLISTGLKFPDDTVQTTAATAGGGTTEAISSGSLSDGSKVVVNADGTVSVVAIAPQTVGTPVVFESANTFNTATVFDSVNNKIVVAYIDNGNSSRGTAVVGTVTGASISFGTPVVFETGSTEYISATFDSIAGKVVIAYRDISNSNRGTAVVGTVSGTSISFGTPAVFNSANTLFTSVSYDVTNNKSVISYRNGGNSNYGTAIVGTVSGTSISFGTAVVFESASTQFCSSVYDSINGKTVISYQDFGSSGFGTAIVGTVSGTSISFGTPVVFESSSVNETVSTFDTVNSKIITAFRRVSTGASLAVVGSVSGTSISFGLAVQFFVDAGYLSTSFNFQSSKVLIAYAGSSSHGNVISGSVLGLSITFGSALVFESASSNSFSMAYDASGAKTVIAYSDFANSSYGTAVVFQPESTNLTAENFIGISDGAYTDTQTATIQVAGAVDDAQTGLTAGQAYYVQPDGTLSTTAGTPEVFAGTAVSSTKLIVKG